MSKTTYTATFADGTVISRKSDREYGFAWLVTTNDAESSASGFSASFELARKASDGFGFAFEYKGRRAVRIGERAGRRVEIVRAEPN